jgi:hypothetical protein
MVLCWEFTVWKRFLFAITMTETFTWWLVYFNNKISLELRADKKCIYLFFWNVFNVTYFQRFKFMNSLNSSKFELKNIKILFRFSFEIVKFCLWKWVRQFWLHFRFEMPKKKIIFLKKFDKMRGWPLLWIFKQNVFGLVSFSFLLQNLFLRISLKVV